MGDECPPQKGGWRGEAAKVNYKNVSFFGKIKICGNKVVAQLAHHIISPYPHPPFS